MTRRLVYYGLPVLNGFVLAYFIALAVSLFMEKRGTYLLAMGGVGIFACLIGGLTLAMVRLWSLCLSAWEQGAGYALGTLNGIDVIYLVWLFDRLQQSGSSNFPVGKAVGHRSGSRWHGGSLRDWQSRGRCT